MTDTRNPDDTPTANGDEPNALDLLVVLAKSKKMLLGLPLLVAVITAGYSLTLPNIFTATTKILPPQQGASSTAALLAQLAGGGLASATGGALKNPSDIYVALLRSRTLADSMVDRFDLVKFYSVPFKSDARKFLEAATTVVVGRDGVISVDVDDADPKRAAELANAYIDELYKLTKVIAVTEASQRRLFFESQLKQAKDNLTTAEVTARQQLDQGGVVKVDDQGRAMVAATAQWRAKISAQEVQISAMRAFATDNNPDLRLAQKELEGMQAALARLEGGNGKIRNVSEKGLDNLKALRDVKYYETLYELLAKQYEVARLDESRDASLIQVLDKAVDPERKSKPKRASMVLTATSIAVFAAVLFVWLRLLLERARRDPSRSRQLNVIRDNLLGR